MTQSKTVQPYQFQFTSADGLHIVCARWDSRALSGSGALDGLGRLAQSGKRSPAEIVNATFQPARTFGSRLNRSHRAGQAGN
jgi:hypothetical protein